MQGRSIKWLKRIVFLLVILYVVGGFILFFIQDILFFHPLPLKKDYAFSFDLPYKELNISSPHASSNILQFQAKGASKGIVLFFHGNMYNMERYKQYPALFVNKGYEFWMIDYPGFGKSRGRRTEGALEEQAQLFYDLAMKKVHADSILIYGKSIGTGVASWLAAHHACKRLILESPYYSIAALSHYYFPIYPSSLARYTFPINEYLLTVHAPVTIFHGNEDEVIPYGQSHDLKEQNPSVELITIDQGHHNDLARFPLFKQKLDSLLKD
ncbi:MAG: alpha/beta hydrolase [Flavisolibacter sp.]